MNINLSRARASDKNKGKKKLIGKKLQQLMLHRNSAMEERTYVRHKMGSFKNIANKRGNNPL